MDSILYVFTVNPIKIEKRKNKKEEEFLLKHPSQPRHLRIQIPPFTGEIRANQA